MNYTEIKDDEQFRNLNFNYEECYTVEGEYDKFECEKIPWFLNFFRSKCDLFMQLAIALFNAALTYEIFDHMKRNPKTTESNTTTLKASIPKFFANKLQLTNNRKKLEYDKNNGLNIEKFSEKTSHLFSTITNGIRILAVAPDSEYVITCSDYLETLYIAARGTVPTQLSDLKSDFNILVDKNVDKGYKDFILENKNVSIFYMMEKRYKLFFCGHSLGGSVVDHFNKNLCNGSYPDLEFLKNYDKKMFITFCRGTGVKENNRNFWNLKTFNYRFQQVDVISKLDVISKGVRPDNNNLVLTLYTEKDKKLDLLYQHVLSTVTELLDMHYKTYCTDHSNIYKKMHELKTWYSDNKGVLDEDIDVRDYSKLFIKFQHLKILKSKIAEIQRHLGEHGEVSDLIWYNDICDFMENTNFNNIVTEVRRQYKELKNHFKERCTNCNDDSTTPSQTDFVDCYNRMKMLKDENGEYSDDLKSCLYLNEQSETELNNYIDDQKKERIKQITQRFKKT